MHKVFYGGNLFSSLRSFLLGAVVITAAIGTSGCSDGKQKANTKISTQEEEVLSRVKNMVQSGRSRSELQEELDFAIKKKQYHIVKYLLEQGVDAASVLRTAARENDAELLSIALASGVGIEYRNGAFLLALRCGNSDIADLIMKSGIDIDCESGNGETALIISVQNGNAEMVEKLIAAGADVNKRNAKNQSALSLAFQAGNEKIVQQLQKAGATEKGVKNEMLYTAVEAGQIKLVK